MKVFYPALFFTLLAGSIALGDTAHLDESFTAESDNWQKLPSAAKIVGGILQIAPAPGNGENCSVTSSDLFRYATLEVRYKWQDLKENRYYMGFFCREPWGAGRCWVMADHGRVKLQVGRESDMGEEKEIPFSEDEEWHILKLVWSATAVELFIDNESRASITDADIIPDVFLPVALDVEARDAEFPPFEIDSVKVIGGELK